MKGRHKGDKMCRVGHTDRERSSLVAEIDVRTFRQRVENYLTPWSSVGRPFIVTYSLPHASARAGWYNTAE